MEQTRVAIVGAGPIGLELAASLKQLGVDYLQFDAGQVGQTISWYPKQARFFSSPDRIAIAGVPLGTVGQEKASREEYLAYLRSVVEQFDLRIRSYERVESIDRDGQSFVLTTRSADGPQRVRAQHVVVAIGDMHRPRTLGVPGEELPHVSHYFDEPHRYFQQRLLIVGGRNSAVEAAIRCHRAGARVSLSYRQGAFDETSVKYWLLPEIKSLIKAGPIGFYPESCVQSIEPGRVNLAQPAEPTRATEHLPADFVLLLTGYEMDPGLLVRAGVTLEGENDAPQFDPQTMQTNVPGLYVAGTAAAGTQRRFRLFIENCHPHVSRITRAITGQDAPRVNPAAKRYALPES